MHIILTNKDELPIPAIFDLYFHPELGNGKTPEKPKFFASQLTFADKLFLEDQTWSDTAMKLLACLGTLGFLPFGLWLAGYADKIDARIKDSQNTAKLIQNAGMGDSEAVNFLYGASKDEVECITSCFYDLSKHLPSAYSILRNYIRNPGDSAVYTIGKALWASYGVQVSNGNLNILEKVNNTNGFNWSTIHSIPMEKLLLLWDSKLNQTK